jgi:excisionase family DNA binding protein
MRLQADWFRNDRDMIQAIKEASHEATKEPLLIDAAEAAKLLSISKRTLWTLTNSREIPSVRIGRSVRYVVADLVKFVNKMKRG